MKVLHLPTSVGGNSWGLAQAEKEIGLESEVLIIEQNWLKYKCDHNLNLQNILFFKRLTKLFQWFKKAKNNYSAQN